MGQALFLKPSLVLKPARAAASGPGSEPEGREGGGRGQPRLPAPAFPASRPLSRENPTTPPPLCFRAGGQGARRPLPAPGGFLFRGCAPAGRRRPAPQRPPGCSAYGLRGRGARAGSREAPGAPLPAPRPRRSQSLPRSRSGPGRSSPASTHLPRAGPRIPPPPAEGGARLSRRRSHRAPRGPDSQSAPRCRGARWNGGGVGPLCEAAGGGRGVAGGGEGWARPVWQFSAAPRSPVRPGGGTVPRGAVPSQVGAGGCQRRSPPSRRQRRRDWGGRARPPAALSDTYLQKKECFNTKT